MKKRELQILKQAAKVLELTSGIKATLKNSRKRSVDFTVSLYLQKLDQPTNIDVVNYFVEVKSQPTRRGLMNLYQLQKTAPIIY